MFIGREKELAELENLYQQNRFQLFVLYGRRRVGKTTLLLEFCKDKETVFYSAEQSNEKMNLDKFSNLVFQHYGETTLEPFSSWENALLYLHNKQTEKPLVLVFDEFPYLAAINPALLSILQHLIDHTLQYGKLFLVLCGSYMGFMEKEVLGAKSPLFGRRTAQLHMKPFDYRTSVKFLEGFSKEEQLTLYGAFGGTAMYLQQISARKSLKENIQNIFLKPTGYLYEEPLLLLRQEVQEPGVYCAIIEAIAGGASKSNEIATKTGEAPAKCLKYIKTLRELGILERKHRLVKRILPAKPCTASPILCSGSGTGMYPAIARYWKWTRRKLCGNEKLPEISAITWDWSLNRCAAITSCIKTARENSLSCLPKLDDGGEQTHRIEKKWKLIWLPKTRRTT